MKRLPLIALTLLALAACRHGDAPQPQPDSTDSVSALPAEPEEEAGENLKPDTLPRQHHPHTATLQTDVAERTDLRLWARKQTVVYDAALLEGEWVSGTEHERYLPDGTGRHWDTGEDVQQAEAQTFRWTLDSNLLTLVFRTRLGGVVPRQYVVTYADEESLAYRDAYGDSYLWDKAPAR